MMNMNIASVPFLHRIPGRRWLLAAAVLLALFIAGFGPRYMAKKSLAAESSAAQQLLPRVKVTPAVAATGGRQLTLPGTLTPNRQALVNARATGYVARWRVDIGDQVHAGDVLAEIDTPELDQQLEQAREALKQKEGAFEQATANRDYAKVTSARQSALFAQDLASKQADDQAAAQFKVSEANVHAAQADIGAAQANVRQLAQLVSFARVTAPFDGRITQRNIDVGTLVSAGSSAAQPMFRIEATDPIRVFIQVPQAYALSVKDAATAIVSVRQMPGSTFDGRVTRTAGTLDPASRTLNVEVDVPNPKGELLGGMFAQVTMGVAVSHSVVRVPSGAVITDAHGVHVATVDGSGIVHLIAVTRGLDNGRDIEIVDGLTAGQQVIANPGADIQDGMRVEAVMGTN